jgi:GNAT superfamily N-acetyltransferase
MIRRCAESDRDVMFGIINDAAIAYRGVIPEDRWQEPYMPMEELEAEIADGVEFWGIGEGGVLDGVMGIQDRGEVALIRHAYVRTRLRRGGLGGLLLAYLLDLTSKPVLIGTWAAADWAVRFYEKHGFRQVTPEEKDRLLRRYWRIPERQVATSVVLADGKYFR